MENNEKKIQQETTFIKHCSANMQEYAESFNIGIETPNFFIVAAAAQCDNGINHLLDGYSWTIIARIYNGKVDVKTMKIHEDELLRLEEAKSKNRKFGLFNGKMPWWRKLLFGRIPQLLYDGRAIQRETPHQPIYYPKLGQLSISSLNHWPTYGNIEWNGDLNPIRSQSYIRNQIPSSHYMCTHPHFDDKAQEVLTFSYLHSKFSRKTTIWFYSFGNNDIQKEPIKYVFNDRLILHMFGFTENYFIIFSTALHMQKGGQCSVNCGSPFLREIDDDSCGEIILHFIPRNGKGDSFNINTKQQGFVYHSINCFQYDDKIIIDAFVSKLNPAREASQFEINTDNPVFDNEGDPFRFVVDLNNRNILSKLITSNLDSSIDFHSINPKQYGLPYKNWYMVSYERQRDFNGNISTVVSTLNAFSIDAPYNDPLKYDVNKTLKYRTNSKEWSNSKIVYLRTPLFVPGENADNDRLVCWCYEENSKELIAYLLFFDTELNLLEKIQMNKKIPYSIHSWGILSD